jgi:hypothetical protein
VIRYEITSFPLRLYACNCTDCWIAFLQSFRVAGVSLASRIRHFQHFIHNVSSIDLRGS